MTVKKRTRKTIEFAISPKGLLLLILLFLSSVTILIFFNYLSHSNRNVSAPIFEEIHATSSSFIEKVVKIDHAIYESLYKGGIPEDNILFLSVSPKHKKSHAWDFTELWIKLPNRPSAYQVSKMIGNALVLLFPDVKYKLQGISEGERVLHIYTQGLYSHKIRLTWDDRLKPVSKRSPKIALIIDDVGYDPDIIDGFLKLDLPFAFSILPKAPYTQQIAKKARKQGHELILHLPMEPTDYPKINPGPGALLTKMSKRKIRATLRHHLDEIPGVRGVNNHMGSFFTTKKDKMAIVMGELKKRNLFYIDSRTTTQTVAHELAEMMGVPVASRSVFLDNDLSQKEIKFQMERLLGMARHSGAAIGIGHPFEETLALLKASLWKLRNRVEVVPVSELIGQVPVVSKVNY